MPRVKLLPENNVRKGFAEAKHVETICKRLSPDVADGVRFAFSTGWRRAEVFTLTWSQIDWSGGFIRLQELTRRCERAQARIIPQVFHRGGRAIHSFRRSWKEACKKAGVPGLLFHDLRRSAVRNLERASVPRSVAMKLTGHKTESIYRRYAIVAEADLREAGVKLSALADSVQKGQATT
jgi:integrase